MLIGELDLNRAERDPAYLARVKAFLLPGHQINPGQGPKSAEPPALCAAAGRPGPVSVTDGTDRELALN
ncbi:MAG: hypothetical protein O2967_13565 [Proteobacteria bacterium]|nr:hypothetical protein [Pseudomonadota bacterium]